MALYLEDLRKAARPRGNGLDGLSVFLQQPAISTLGWPAEVVRQWLWEHGENGPFLRDYAGVDLSRVCWTLETVPAADLETMPTGPSDGDCIEEYARNHRHYLALRQQYQPEIVHVWENEGTWHVPPILISRLLLQPPSDGLQVVEGRTRVGLLSGRRRDRLLVAEHHRAWVGRPRPQVALEG